MTLACLHRQMTCPTLYHMTFVILIYSCEKKNKQMFHSHYIKIHNNFYCVDKVENVL